MCRIRLISRLLVRGDDVRAFFTRLQTSTLQCFLQTREPEFTEHCWQPFRKGDETRGNSSVANANSQRSGSTTGCFSCFPFQGWHKSLSLVQWAWQLGSAAALCCVCSDGFRRRRFSWKQAPYVSPFKAFCSGQSLRSPFSSYNYISRRVPVFPDSAPVNQNKNWEKLLAVFSSFFAIWNTSEWDWR